MRRGQLPIYILLYYLFCILDIYSTFLVVSVYGGSEVNPTIQFFIKIFPRTYFVLLLIIQLFFADILRRILLFVYSMLRNYTEGLVVVYMVMIIILLIKIYAILNNTFVLLSLHSNS